MRGAIPPVALTFSFGGAKLSNFAFSYFQRTLFFIFPSNKRRLTLGCITTFFTFLNVISRGKITA